MEVSWCLLSKHKSSSLLIIVMMILLFFMVGWIQGLSIEEDDQRRALVEIKASLHEISKSLHVYDILPTWVDDGGKYCDWERIKCDATSTYVTEISFGNIFSMDNDDDYYNYRDMDPLERKIWALNASLFLHFEELTSLDLSMNYIGNTFVSTGLKELSSLKKLEMLNLSRNYIETNIFPSLSGLTSLKILDLSFINGYGYIDSEVPTYEIFELAALENLEILLLQHCGFHGTLEMQGTTNLSSNRFNKSLITSLRSLTSLKTLDLRNNGLTGSFPSQALSHFSNLERLDLYSNYFNDTASIEDCKSLMRLKKLVSVSLGRNNFNKSIISCLSFLPSLNNLDLSFSTDFIGGSLPMQVTELSSFRELKTLDLSFCGFESFSLNELPNSHGLEVLLLRGNYFNGTLPMKALSSLRELKTLDLSYCRFESFPTNELPHSRGLEVLLLRGNNFNGTLPMKGLCELTHLQELDLSNNNFDGNIPQCFNMLSSLKVFDISSNQFTGILPPSLFVNLTSLEYIDLSHNKIEGSFSFNTFSNHTKLKFVQLEMDGDKFEVETEDPIGWIPMFQLKILMLPNCNINKPKGSIVPSFLFHQHKLLVLDLSHNSLEGQLPNWLLKNNTELEVLILRKNSFGGVIDMGSENLILKELDMSENLLTGTISENIPKLIPRIQYLDFSRNSLNGVIPNLVCDLGELNQLDLSNNELSGEVPNGLLFTSLPQLRLIRLSNNKLYGRVLSGNISFGRINRIYLDNNNFTGNIHNTTMKYMELSLLDISNNHFTGKIPSWMSNMADESTLIVRNNHFEGEFPCGNTYFLILDISQNSFSGPIPSCLNFEHMKYLHLGSNRFTGLIPDAFRNLTNVLTLDISHNNLSGNIPEFLGELSMLRVLLLGRNKFVGSIPEHLCHLKNVSLMDISSNSLTGLIPRCLKNLTGPKELAYIKGTSYVDGKYISEYVDILPHSIDFSIHYQPDTKDAVQFTTKNNSLTYFGNILNNMSGLDLSCKKLTGEIPEELGTLTQFLALNLSHNALTGPIPVNLSNLVKIESLDLSSNRLSGKVPSELNKLTSLEVFDVSYNNLSGRLPEWKAQFLTFTKESYKGNPLLCGQPLEKNCTPTQHVSGLPSKEGTEKWYDIDKASFYGSSSSTWFLFMLGFAAVLFVNPYWRRWWFEFFEECMYTCYYFLYDFVRKIYRLFHE